MLFRAKELVVTWWLLALLLVLVSGSSNVGLASDSRIGIIVEKDNTATYVETLEGFRQELERNGIRYEFVTRFSNNNRGRMASQAKEFSQDESIRSVVILGSAAATIGSSYISNKPVIFGGVNHPKKLGISGSNVTGTTYFVSPTAVINLIQKLNPLVRRIGLLYEPWDQNQASLVEVPEIEAAVKKRGLILVKASVRKKESIRDRASQVLAQDIDYLIIPTNRLLYSNVEDIRSITDRAGVPIVSFSRRGVFGGALIGLTSNNTKLGEKMGQILIDIIEKDIPPEKIAWYFPKKYTILINDQTRTELGIQIPKKIYSIATKINRTDQ